MAITELLSDLLLSGTLFVLTHISTAPLPGWQRDHCHDFQDNSGSKQSSFLSLVVFALVVVGSCLVYRRHPYWLRLGSAAISSLMQIWFKLADNSHLHPHPQSTIHIHIHILPIWRALSSFTQVNPSQVLIMINQVYWTLNRQQNKKKNFNSLSS